MNLIRVSITDERFEKTRFIMIKVARTNRIRRRLELLQFAEKT
jgi:hypothetical protein